MRMVQISDHYLPYLEGTLIVVASGEHVRILEAKGRDVVELDKLDASSWQGEREKQLYAASHEDEQERQYRLHLYSALRAYLEKKHPSAIVMCAPEVYQNEVKDALSNEQRDLITQFIPKNLASLPIDAIVRILQEKQA